MSILDCNQNLFQIWKENDEKLPCKAIRNSWSEAKGHFVLVEKIEIGKWPYGKAYGQYFYYGKPGKIGIIDCAGTYAWKLKKEI